MKKFKINKIQFCELCKDKVAAVDVVEDKYVCYMHWKLSKGEDMEKTH